MNWKIEGKNAKGKKGSFALIGPADEKAAREYAAAMRPDVEIETVTPVDSNLRATQAAATEVAPAEPASKPAAKKK